MYRSSNDSCGSRGTRPPKRDLSVGGLPFPILPSPLAAKPKPAVRRLDASELVAPSWGLDEYRNNDPFEPFNPSFTNPYNSNANCASVSAARLNGFNTADDMFSSVYGVPAPEGLSTRDVNNMLQNTGRNFEVTTFPEDPTGAGPTPYQALEAHMAQRAADKTLNDDAFLVGYIRADKQSGHAVNGYRDANSSRLRLLDYQHSNFGDRLPPGDIETACDITIFRQPARGTCSAEELAVAERNAARCAEGKLSVSEWTTGPRVQDGPLPGWYALHDHVYGGEPGMRLEANDSGPRW